LAQGSEQGQDKLLLLPNRKSCTLPKVPATTTTTTITRRGDGAGAIGRRTRIFYPLLQSSSHNNNHNAAGQRSRWISGGKRGLNIYPWQSATTIFRCNGEEKEMNEEQKPRPTRYCRRCRLELIHTGHGRLRAATSEQVDGAPSFTLIGPRVLVTHCPRCHYSSVWVGREAAAGDVARAEGMARAENARLDSG
jgi:hypothetical protein